jgi:hypothetical protein
MYFLLTIKISSLTSAHCCISSSTSWPAHCCISSSTSWPRHLTVRTSEVLGSQNAHGRHLRRSPMQRSPAVKYAGSPGSDVRRHCRWWPSRSVAKVEEPPPWRAAFGFTSAAGAAVGQGGARRCALGSHGEARANLQCSSAMAGNVPSSLVKRHGCPWRRRADSGGGRVTFREALRATGSWVHGREPRPHQSNDRHRKAAGSDGLRANGRREPVNRPRY